MEMKDSYVNQAKIVGEIVTELKSDEEATYGKDMYKTEVYVRRLSSNVDAIPLIIPESVLKECNFCIQPGIRVSVTGRIRTRRKLGEDGKMHLLLHVYANDVKKAEKGEKDENEIMLGGVLKKQPLCEVTPRGKVITEFIISNCSDEQEICSYIPCIAWNDRAYTIAALNKNDDVVFLGRFQSREYCKKLEDKSSDTGFRTEIRTTYEISVYDLIW